MNRTVDEPVPALKTETAKPRGRPTRRAPLLKWLVLAAVLAGGIWGGIRYWTRPASGNLEYKTSPVTRGDITQSVTANGSLTPVQLVEVGSQISGVITEIKVDFNSRVKAGEVVAQIDPATYERALGQAVAELANAEAAQELAQLNFTRAEELYKGNLISKSEFDQQRISLNQAKAQVKTRQANVDRAQVDLDRTTIHAPIDGVVITRRVEAGQTVAAAMNAPLLFTIANDLSKMRIEAAVSEADVGGVEEGQKVQFTVDAFPGRMFEGNVKQVRFAASTNQNVVTYCTVVEVDNKDLKLRPGMTASARFITAERKNVVKIPNAAVRFRPPAGVTVIGDTNTATAAANSGPALIEDGPFAGLPMMPWMTGGERRRPTDAERAAYAATLTPEQKQKYEKVMAEFRARMAQGGGPGGAGGPGGQGFGGGGLGSGAPGAGAMRSRAESTGPKSATVYVVEKQPANGQIGQIGLRAVTVKLGISDASSVEVLEGLTEKDQVVSGTVAAPVVTGPRNPFSPFGGPGRPR
jgi:HlyD family secretion protein